MSLQREHAQGLLARARDDHYVVRRLVTEPEAPVWVLGFHAQQAVEKAIKAVLSAASLVYPRSHNLVMLLELLKMAQKSLPPDEAEIGLLVPFGVALRYDDMPDDIPPSFAPDWFEQVARRTIEWAQDCLAAEN